MYTPGFAPPELYNARDRLGPWTDIYSVGASMYACLAKSPPQPADDRLKKDRLIPAGKAFADEYSPRFLELIDDMMQLSYTARPQSVFAVQKRLIELHREAASKPRPNLLNLIRDKLSG
jgi:hypothetical protein